MEENIDNIIDNFGNCSKRFQIGYKEAQEYFRLERRDEPQDVHTRIKKSKYCPNPDILLFFMSRKTA